MSIRYTLSPRPHILVSGDHAKELFVFLSEFFHPDHGDNITDIVIFGYNPPDPTIIPRLGVQPQGNVTEYIQIQPGEYSELSRSRCDKANAVFILNSSAAHGDPRDLDSRASLYAVLVKQYERSTITARWGSRRVRYLKSSGGLDVPVHVQLLLNDSVHALRSILNYMFGASAQQGSAVIHHNDVNRHYAVRLHLLLRRPASLPRCP